MSDTRTITVRYRYLDASAALKLVTQEAGSNAVRQYFEAGGPFYITPACAVEVVSVLKAKKFFRRELTADQYSAALHGFLAHLRCRLKLRGPSLEEAAMFWEADELSRRYEVDFIDALQLATIKHTPGAGPSQPLFITADETLANAARAESIDVWDCIREVTPK